MWGGGEENEGEFQREYTRFGEKTRAILELQQKVRRRNHENEKIVTIIPKIEKNNRETTQPLHHSPDPQKCPRFSIMPIDIFRNDHLRSKIRTRKEQDLKLEVNVDYYHQA